MKPVTIALSPREGAPTITRQLALDLFGANAVRTGEQRGNLETRGPWSIPLRYTAQAVTKTTVHVPWSAYPEPVSVTFHGPRTGYAPRQGSYTLEGRVSVAGKKRSAFTSTQLFKISDPAPGEARFLEVAVWYCRT